MEATLPLRYAVYDTAIGDVTLIANERRLVGMLFGSKDPIGAVNDENTALYDGIIELNQYCYGQRRKFDLRFEPIKDPEAAKVYEEVSKIPYGETMLLEELSAKVGLDKERVSELLFENPLPIFIPSHRIKESKESSGRLAGCDQKMYDLGQDVELHEKLIAFEAANKDREFLPGR